MHSSSEALQGLISEKAGGSSFGYARFLKRVLDLVLGLLILPSILPVLLVLYVLVRLEGGPGFFGHQRVGRSGKMFKCWKIRTMVPDAQQRLQELLASDPNAKAEWERDQKLRNDPRVTKLGNFLRSSSLDELPQIWNVLKGEMSLIGPRPVTQAEMIRYGAQKDVYLALRPGITGLWQISGRNDLSYSERVSLDASYLERMSLRQDLRILLGTVNTVLKRTGC
ncbi:exopolysaccharide biosynthesis protein (plasmid) [Salipiger sp. CCB-MM3]|nr:sugar transferase [Salipiger sp. CCB-MM3]ANT63366.1 exopolysaccharide biosynthesis protein [Salipiger sp. CCB-MM3]